MIDLEEHLSAALHRYAESVQPSPPEPSSTTITFRAVPGSPVAHRRVMLAAAAAVLLIGGLVAWTAGREADGPDLPTTPPGTGHWTAVQAAPISSRTRASTVWTGKEFIVWGGDPNDTGKQLSDGAAYNPASRTWRRIADHTFSQFHTRAVWTGERMVVLDRSQGAAYDPTVDAWTNLPSIGAFSIGSLGFDDLAVVDGHVLAYGFLQSQTQPETNDSAAPSTTVQVWTLSPDGRNWETSGPTVLDDDGVQTFGLHQPVVATSDGFVVWGLPSGWRYRPAEGWERLPTFTEFGGNTRAAWVDGSLVVIANGVVESGFSVSILDGTAWTPVRQMPPKGMVDFQVATFGNHVVVIGFGFDPDPLLVDPVAAIATSMHGFPLGTVAGQAIGSSGSQLFVWGGQKVNNATITTTGLSIASSADSTSSLTNTGAIWTP